MSIDLLTSANIYAKAINFTDFDIFPITQDNDTAINIVPGDNIFISPPVTYYLIDKNNNAYRNITYPPNVNPLNPPSNVIINIPLLSTYGVLENQTGVLLAPTVEDGWRVSKDLPIPPSTTIPSNDANNNSNNSTNNTNTFSLSSVNWYYVLYFIILLAFLLLIIYTKNSSNNRENYPIPYYS